MKKTIFILLFLNSFFLNAQNAQDIIDGLKKELKANPDDKKRATIYSDLTWYYSNISLDSAMAYGKKAIIESTKLGDSTLIAQVYSDVGAVYLKKGNYDESLKFYNKSLIIRKLKKDILGISKAYSCIGSVYNYQNKYELSMKYYLNALDYVNKTDDEKVKINIKNAMSTLFLDLKYFKKALLFNQQAIDYYTKNNSNAPLCSIYLNQGNICLAMKDTLSALKMYEISKKICENTGNKLFLSKTLNNIGIIKQAQKKYKDSNKFFNESLKNRSQVKSEFLSYKSKFNEIDKLNRSKKFRDSKILLIQLKKYSITANDNENLINTYKVLIPVCANLGELDSVSMYQEKYLTISQKINDTNILIKTAELETKYQTTQKEKLILKQQAEAKQKNIWLLLISSLAIIGLLLFRQQRMKSRQQKEQAKLENELLQEQANFKIQEQRLDISRELHDSVGSQLTFIISILDNLKNAPVKLENAIEKKIDNLSGYANTSISELRDTIWALNTENLTVKVLETRILNFIKDAGESVENIDFNFKNNIQTDQILTSKQGINIFRVLQETVNNAVKHAKATEIHVILDENQNQLSMKIQDNGKGFDYEEKKKKSYGLSNIKNRVEELNGVFDLVSSDYGTTINISIPISK